MTLSTARGFSAPSGGSGGCLRSNQPSPGPGEYRRGAGNAVRGVGDAGCILGRSRQGVKEASYRSGGLPNVRTANPPIPRFAACRPLDMSATLAYNARCCGGASPGPPVNTIVCLQVPKKTGRGDPTSWRGFPSHGPSGRRGVFLLDSPTKVSSPNDLA
jgi:hypothetical protein